MSSCLILQDINNIFIGADTAASINIGNDFYRLPYDIQKIYAYENGYYFCCGYAISVNKIVRFIEENYNKIDIKELSRKLLKEFGKKYILKNDYSYDIEIIVADMNKNVVYQLSQYNNFEPIIYIPKINQVNIICGGYKTKELYDNVLCNIGSSDVIQIYNNAFLSINDECVGGTMQLYSKKHKIEIDMPDDNVKYVDFAYNKIHLLNSDFVLAGTVVAGNIYSGNYSSSKKTGSRINLNDGTFTLADNKIVYADGTLTFRGVTIEWDNTNAPEIIDISGLKDYLSQLDGRIQTYSQASDPSDNWTSAEKNNHIGDIWLRTSTPTGTYRWNGSSWLLINDEVMSELAKSKAQIFTSTPTIPYYRGDLWVQGSTGDIKHCITTRTTGNYTDSDWKVSSKYTDDTVANNALTTANSAKSVADNAKTIGDNLVNVLGYDGTKITGTYIYSPVISGGSILVGDKVGTYAEITTEGVLNCTGANITGVIHATSGGTIGGFNIGKSSINNGTDSLTSTTVGLYLGTDGIRQYNSDSAYVNISNGILNAMGANFSGTITGSAISGGTISGSYINGATFINTKDYGGSSCTLRINGAELIGGYDGEGLTYIDFSNRTGGVCGLNITGENLLTFIAPEFYVGNPKTSSLVYKGLNGWVQINGGCSLYFMNGILVGHYTGATGTTLPYAYYGSIAP